VYELAIGPVVVCSTLIDGLVAIGLLVPLHGRGEIGCRRVIRGVFGTTLVFVAKFPFLVIGGLNLFGLIRLVYTDAVVLVPLLGLLVLLGELARRWRLDHLHPVLACASLSLAMIGVYATWIEPFHLRLETARLSMSDERQGSALMRLAVLSDLQTDCVTEYEHEAVRPPDGRSTRCHFRSGRRVPGQRGCLRGSVARTSSPAVEAECAGGVFLVPGNVDVPVSRIGRMISGTRIRPLSTRWRRWSSAIGV